MTALGLGDRFRIGECDLDRDLFLLEYRPAGDLLFLLSLELLLLLLLLREERERDRDSLAGERDFLGTEGDLEADFSFLGNTTGLLTSSLANCGDCGVVGSFFTITLTGGGGGGRALIGLSVNGGGEGFLGTLTEGGGVGFLLSMLVFLFGTGDLLLLLLALLLREEPEEEPLDEEWDDPLLLELLLLLIIREGEKREGIREKREGRG